MTQIPATDDPSFENLLEYLNRSHGFDFTGYKRASLMRRMSRRLDDLGVANFAEYTDYLQVHPQEFAALFDTILINVTSFFRDPDAWDYLRENAIRPIIEAKVDSEAPIRVWSAGCASGEEPCTIAMLFCEEMGEEAFKSRVKIYATDVDEDALALARAGSYTAKDVSSVPDDLKAKYFEQQGSRYVFRGDLRRCIIFGRHDLSQDAAISRLDLMVCRNTLMYFTADTQSRILARLHYSLNNDGFLFLGRAEMLLSHTNLFTPLDARNRVFVKVPKDTARRVVALPGAVGRTDGAGSPGIVVQDLVFEESPVATLVVGPQGALVLCNRKCRETFEISTRDLGRPFQDLEISYRPVELRDRMEQAHRRNAPVVLPDIERRRMNGELQRLHVTVIPLAIDGTSNGTAIAFQDVTDFHRVKSELLSSKQELETAYEELQSTNEELETTNEELQSTVEELETTNEEFQSANEELETMNEELQSTNGELNTVNSELRERSRELDQISVFMNAVLGSLYFGIIVLDKDGTIQTWNAEAQEMWGLRSDEVTGENFFGLDIGLPVDDLQAAVSRAAVAPLTPRSETVLRCANRRGRMIDCRVVVLPLRGAGGKPDGAIVLTEDLAGRDGNEAAG